MKASVVGISLSGLGGWDTHSFRALDRQQAALIRQLDASRKHLSGLLAIAAGDNDVNDGFGRRIYGMARLDRARRRGLAVWRWAHGINGGKVPASGRASLRKKLCITP